MTLPTYEEFTSAALAQGFDEVLVRDWQPGLVIDTHTHAFGVSALVVAGRLSLGVGGATAHLTAGNRFELEPGVPHSERYGPEGATFWVARRHPSA
jgi:quercetin dioxygenase-like cupin family protein